MGLFLFPRKIELMNVLGKSGGLFPHSFNLILRSSKASKLIYVIMKTMCPPGYHHNGFVATHALGHMM